MVDLRIKDGLNSQHDHVHRALTTGFTAAAGV